MTTSIKKAVTSEAAPAENSPENSAAMNGETAPTIQAAKPATTPEVPAPVAAAPVPASNVPEVKQQEVPAALQPVKKEPNFGGLFKPFSMGATLKQDPNSGQNQIAGISQPKMDYVKHSGNKKNIKMSEDDFKPKK